MIIVESKYRDIIKEVINIGVGKGAAILNNLLRSHIELTVPSLFFLKGDQISLFFSTFHDKQLSVVTMPFSSEISGSAKLLFPTESAIKLVNLFVKAQVHPFTGDIDLIKANTLSEIGNIVINAVIGTISNQLKIHFRYSVPTYAEGDASHTIIGDSNLDDWIILVCKTNFTVQSMQIEGTFILLFEIDSLDEFTELLDNLHSDFLSS